MTGLILEGGGMRGAFTAGVLDAFLEKNLHFDAVYGVSAGASNGASYVSRQPGRNRKVFVEGVKNYRYFSLRHLFRQKSLLDIKLLFDTYPNHLIPFDYEAFEASPSNFYTVLTDCESGQPAYIERRSVGREDFMMKVLAGSNSLPLVSPPAELGGRFYLDGGLSDSIPLKRAEQDGCTRNVVILTREEGYRKSPSGMNPLVKAAYRKYPAVISCFEGRHDRYNESLDYCDAAMEQGRAVIIRPGSTMGVRRTETSFSKLDALYTLGLETGRAETGKNNLPGPDYHKTS